MEKIVQIFFSFSFQVIKCIWFSLVACEVFSPDACCPFSLGNYSYGKLKSLFNFYLKESENTNGLMIVKDSLFRQYSAWGVAGIFWTTEEVVGKK